MLDAAVSLALLNYKSLPQARDVTLSAIWIYFFKLFWNWSIDIIIYNIVFASGVQQSDSVIYAYI